jgi:hypothetical protein
VGHLVDGLAHGTADVVVIIHDHDPGADTGRDGTLVALGRHHPVRYHPGWREGHGSEQMAR